MTFTSERDGVRSRDIHHPGAPMASSPIVILSGARTPIGKLSGSFGSFSAVELGGVAVGAALDKAGLSGEQIDYVYMGHVLQAGAGRGCQPAVGDTRAAGDYGSI
jgi:acetyl-CoA acetyltransferase